ncbi:SagB/ThcOx family dehydrogenase [Leucobacter sp. UCMA 4100]|uniref:SagB/ThcOx family dehydrogenase n=1 Tax=Leucobacter sp. UCMA 4100 TaxID=2810534 RepID=UPI002A44DC42|nr:SagB/ThcOx family dehydrogenase [Leucobacter sp. UCMA 4100]
MSSQSDSEGTSGRSDDCGIVLNAVQGGSAIAEALRRRRSIKMYRPDQIALATMSRLLGEAVGSAPDTRRPYGSAHARYDIQVTVVAAAVDGLDPGAYKYLPEEHSLAGAVYGDHRTGLAEGTLDAAWLRQCPLILVLSADLSAANRAFESQRASRGESFCWFEAGLVSQNVYLWAAENGLGTVFLGGLDSARMRSATQLWIPRSHSVLGMLPVGYPADPETSAQ